MKRRNIVVLVLVVLAVIEAFFLIRVWLSPVRKKAYKPKPVARQAIKGRIAIVLDDWGYSLNNLGALKQIRRPLTIAVLPNLPYSTQINQAAHTYGFEVILHLPLEPDIKRNLEKNTILASMDEAMIKNIVASDLKSASFARGVNNHMGSFATKDARVMEVVFSELKQKGLYFLDSYVSGGSVCLEIANNMGVDFARRDVFIDNKADTEYIAQQIEKLKEIARRNGRAIGIGHDRPATLQALKEEMPRIEEEGYKFVFVSEIVK